MHNRKSRIAVAVLCIGIGCWALPSHAEDRPSCIDGGIALGQRSVTPALVIGKPGERLELPATWRNDLFDTQKRLLNKSYLITGDRVDLIARCEDYAYVRFHGPKRVSTGWVVASRIKATGQAYVPLPPNAGALCLAAEQALNKGGENPLHPLPTTILDEATTRRLGEVAARVSFIAVEGRRLAIVSSIGDGSCHSTTISVHTGDLKSPLTPNDAADRHILHTDSTNGWDFGMNEQAVMVMGQPMVMSKFSGPDFSLSTIDKDGDLIPTCTASLVPLERRTLISSTDGEVCHAILAGKAEPVPTQVPAENESLLVADDPKTRTSGKYLDDGHTSMTFEGARASTANVNLYATADVDLDNSGKLRRVGLVSFSDDGSSAGCGDYNDSQVVPMYLNEHGVADASAAVNEPFQETLPHGMRQGRLVSYNGTAYLELSPTEQGPASEVWKFDAKGPHQVCEFQLEHYVVRTITEPEIH